MHLQYQYLYPSNPWIPLLLCLTTWYAKLKEEPPYAIRRMAGKHLLPRVQFDDGYLKNNQTVLSEVTKRLES